jgi:hypothetical protein
MRTSIFVALLCVSAVVLVATSRSADPPAPVADSWEGTYARRGWANGGGVDEHVTITKSGDGYYLSKPYDGRKFTEVEKGVLSDDKGGLGRIYAGAATFSDGTRFKILRVEFCYESFFLNGARDLAAGSGAKSQK